MQYWRQSNPETVSFSTSTLLFNPAHLGRTDTVSDESIEKLGVLFSDQLLLAALDLIDRDCGEHISSFHNETKAEVRRQ